MKFFFSEWCLFCYIKQMNFVPGKEKYFALMSNEGKDDAK